MVYYSDSAVVAQKFTGENTKVDVVAYLNNLHHVGGQTNTESALHLSYEEFRFNCRPEAIRALLIVTDGHSENEVRGLKVEVDKLNSIGVKVFAATVSDNAAYDELKLYSQSGKYFLKNNLTDVNAEVLKVLQPPVCADHQLTDDPNLSLNLKSAMQENTLQPIFGSAITLSKSYGRRSDPTSEINKSLINEKN